MSWKLVKDDDRCTIWEVKFGYIYIQVSSYNFQSGHWNAFVDGAIYESGLPTLEEAKAAAIEGLSVLIDKLECSIDKAKDFMELNGFKYDRQSI
jgi:hypothetical protein